MIIGGCGLLSNISQDCNGRHSCVLLIGAGGGWRVSPINHVNGVTQTVNNTIERCNDAAPARPAWSPVARGNYRRLWLGLPSREPPPSPHHSWMDQSTKIATREVVYYILSGTPRAPQKCFWSNLRVEFLGENHLFLICEKMPNQTLQLIKYLDSGWNSDLFEKKNCWNPSTNCKVRAVQKWLPFSKNVQKLLSVTVQTCPIWNFFFF